LPFNEHDGRKYERIPELYSSPKSAVKLRMIKSS
jgi:hypothetical protein